MTPNPSFERTPSGAAQVKRWALKVVWCNEHDLSNGCIHRSDNGFANIERRVRAAGA